MTRNQTIRDRATTLTRSAGILGCFLLASQGASIAQSSTQRPINSPVVVAPAAMAGAGGTPFYAACTAGDGVTPQPSLLCYITVSTGEEYVIQNISLYGAGSASIPFVSSIVLGSEIFFIMDQSPYGNQGSGNVYSLSVSIAGYSVTVP